MELRKRDAVKPLGSHTAVGHLHELRKWKEMPYLKDNMGMLPPFMIAVGSRVRAGRAIDVLKLENPVMIDEVAWNKIGPEARGRTSVLVGIFRSKGFAVPLTVFETQMGCSATQIIAREIMYFSKDDGYRIGKEKMRSDGLYVIRAGTCGGVNSHVPSEYRVKIGDVLIATESYGSVGAMVQSALRELNYTGICIAERADELRRQLGESLSIRLSDDLANLATRCRPRVVLQLQKTARELGLNAIAGANFTKDSLYAEMGEEGFARLRDNYGVVSTEMEQQILDVLAAEFSHAGIPAHSGLVSAAIGAIPGKSFPDTKDEKIAASQAEENALKLAANTLANIAKQLN